MKTFSAIINHIHDRTENWPRGHFCCKHNKMMRGEHYRTCDLILTEEIKKLEDEHDISHLKEALANLGHRQAFNRFTFIKQMNPKALKTLKMSAYKALGYRRLQLADHVLKGNILPVKYANANEDLKRQRTQVGIRDGISAVKPFLSSTIAEQMAAAADAMKHWLE
jgi:recombinational DNA repair ATPase RecF